MVRPTLPSFENPPVREVAIAVALNGLGIKAVHLGLLWERFRDLYPNFEEHGPVPNVIEDFKAPVQPPGVAFQFSDAPPAPRVWFMSEDMTNLIQIQSDRIGANWRKISGEEQYPRFQHVRNSFESSFSKVTEFLTEDQPTKQITATQCEVAYYNEIPAAGIENHGDPDPVLRLWTPVDDVFPGQAEDVRIGTRHRLKPDPRTQGARLHIELQPAVKNERAAPLLPTIAHGPGCSVNAGPRRSTGIRGPRPRGHRERLRFDHHREHA